MERTKMEGGNQHYLTERMAFARQDDHHGDVISSVRHLQQLHLLVGEALVVELDLLEHHADLAGATRVDVEVCGHQVLFGELVFPQTLRAQRKRSGTSLTASAHLC